MAIKSKINFQVPTGNGKHKSVDWYGISLAPEYNNWQVVNYGGREYQTWGWYFNKEKNKYEIRRFVQTGIITAIKNETLGSAFDFKKDFCDDENSYEKCLYYPMMYALSNYSSLSGTLVPRNTNYPKLLKFPAVEFSGIINSTAALAHKKDTRFSILFKPFIVDASRITNRAMTRKDKYYFDIESLKILHIDTGKELLCNDEDIHRPENNLYKYTYNEEKKFYDFTYLFKFKAEHINERLRNWDVKDYYASKIKAPKYIRNMEKEEAFVKSHLKDGETFIGYYTLNELSKEDKIRFLLSNSGYEYNVKDRTITIDNKKYYIDIDLEEIRDENFKIVEYVKRKDGVIFTLNPDLNPISYLNSNQKIQDQIKDVVNLAKDNKLDTLKNKYKKEISSIYDKWQTVVGSRNSDKLFMLKNNNVYEKIDAKIYPYKIAEFIVNSKKRLKEVLISLLYDIKVLNNYDSYNNYIKISKYNNEGYNDSNKIIASYKDYNIIDGKRYNLKDKNKKEIPYTNYRNKDYSDNVYYALTLYDFLNKTDANSSYSKNTIDSTKRSEILLTSKDYIQMLYKGYNYINKTKDSKGKTKTEIIDESGKIFSSVINHLNYEQGDFCLYQSRRKFTFFYNDLSDQDKNISSVYGLNQLSLMVFPLINTFNNIQKTDNFNGSYNIYFHKIVTYDDNKDIKQTYYLPILCFDGIINSVSGYSNKRIHKFKKLTIDPKERSNYNGIIERDGKLIYYKNISSKLDFPQEYDYYIFDTDKEGNIQETVEKRTEYYSSTPQLKYEEKTITELSKFPLDIFSMSLDLKLKNLIDASKNNSLNGIFLKVKNFNNNIFIRYIDISQEEVIKKISDVKHNFYDVMPTLPFFSKIDYLVPIIASSRYSEAFAELISLITIVDLFFGIIKEAIIRRFGLLFGGSSYINFYYSKNKILNQYYKKVYGIHPTEFNMAINKDVPGKIDYSPKKLQKRYTNKRLLNYTEGILPDSFNSNDTHKKATDSYESYYKDPNHGAYGAYIGVKFHFAIYFNKFVRRTVLLSKMGWIYLDFYFGENKNGIEEIISLYPPDTLSYPEKRLYLKCKKEYIDDKEIKTVPASFITDFNYYTGYMTFYNRAKRIKYIININTLYPKWKSTFFKNKTFIKGQKINMLDTLSPLTYTDMYVPKSKRTTPVDTYTFLRGRYQLKLKSYYYNTPITIRFKNSKGEVLRRTINFWRRPSNFCCFYTPYDKQDIFYGANNTFADNTQLPTVDEYLDKIFQIKSNNELEDIYSKIFDKNIVIFQQEEIFNYKGQTEKLFKKIELDFEKETDDKIEKYDYDIPLEITNSEKKEAYTNIELKQRVALYEFYDKDMLIYFNPLNDRIGRFEAINAIKDEIKKELPPDQIILVKEWPQYFVEYNKEGILAKLFTDREIYELGFKCYLVTDILFDYNEPTVLLEEIQNKIGSFVVDMNPAENIFVTQCFLLPMPLQVYKRLPMYCKYFAKSFMTIIQQYRCQSIPSKNAEIYHKNKIYKIVLQILGIIFGIILIVVGLTLVSYGQVWALPLIFMGLSIMFSSLFSLLTLLFPEHRELFSAINMAVQTIITVVGIAFGGVTAIPNLLVSKIIMAVTIVVQIVTIALQLATEVIKLEKQAELNSLQEKVNSTIELYNQSTEELYGFIEENEFNDILLENTANMDLAVARLMPHNREDGFYQEMTSLEIAYNEVEYYYNKRLD